MLHHAHLDMKGGNCAFAAPARAPPQFNGSSPYEFALNSSFYDHNYTFREKRFELWLKRHDREKLSKK
jgi:hypothetical protein